MTLGHFSLAFLKSPAQVETHEFWGIALIVIALAIYWSHFVNDMS
jgi:hypothetical protein